MAYTQLTVDRDPTIWTLRNPILNPSEITGAGAPLALGIRRPLDGVLLLSVKAAAFVTLFPAPVGPTPTGWIFDDLPTPLPSLFLYLPSVSIPAATGPVLYQMPASATLAELQTTITSAMISSAKIAVSFEIGGSVGEVVVNGAALPFAVIVPTGAQAPVGG